MGANKVGLSVRNSGKIPPGYQFKVKLKIDGQVAGTITVDGDPRNFKKGFLKLDAPIQGRHTLEYKRVNDFWRPKEGNDANIRIRQFLFR